MWIAKLYMGLEGRALICGTFATRDEAIEVVNACAEQHRAQGHTVLGLSANAEQWSLRWWEKWWLPIEGVTRE